MSAVLEIKQLNIKGVFKNEEKAIVSDLSFTAEKGEKIAIVGESGCGKTMTANSIFGLLPKNCIPSGEIFLNGKDLLKMKKTEIEALRGVEIVMIPSGAEFLNPVLTVQTQIFESLKRVGIKGKTAKTQIALEAMKKVGLENASEILKMYPFMLSGGMAQRVVIAIASVSSPSLVIADELTRGIDGKTANAIVDTLENIFTNTAIIIITHDISLAKKCDKTLVMYGGKIVEFGNSSEILKNPTHFYTKSLIEALPQNGLKISEKINAYPETYQENCCPFVNYCEKATVECSKKTPQLIEVDGKKVRCQNA